MQAIHDQFTRVNVGLPDMLNENTNCVKQFHVVLHFIGSYLVFLYRPIFVKQLKKLPMILNIGGNR